MRGYKTLNAIEKERFDKFKKVFLQVNDSEIKFVSVARKSGYLRVDLEINRRNEWLHVTPYGWY